MKKSNGAKNQIATLKQQNWVHQPQKFSKC